MSDAQKVWYAKKSVRQTEARRTSGSPFHARKAGASIGLAAQILEGGLRRDLQMKEMKVGLGPAKGKEFATSIGPFLVTPDEIADRIVDRQRGYSYDLTMTARVNGEEYSRGNLRDIHWTFAEMIGQASRNTVLKPGDLIGSGTVGTGCIVEFPEGTRPWLQTGDVVELEIERLGVLRNSVKG